MLIVAAPADSPSRDPWWSLEALSCWAGVTSQWELGLVIFGLAAQVTFILRWAIQWRASERLGQSHMPISFWWLSLIGATMLLVYFGLRGEPVGVLGQSLGWVIYGRNLYMIRKQDHRDISRPGSQETLGD